MLNDARIVELLSERFVPIAVDNVDHPNMTPAEKAFVWERGFKACTQGMSVFTADGRVLAMGGGFEAGGVHQMLQNALAKFATLPRPEAWEPLDPAGAEAVCHPPEGGLVLYVTWRVLGPQRTESSPTSANGTYDREFARALGVDRLWVRKDEAEMLARGEFPESLIRRMRPHLDYALAGKVTQCQFRIEKGRILGTIGTDEGGPVNSLGFIDVAEGQVTGFEVILTGRAERVEDFGFSAGLTVVPKGQRTTVGVAFMLADPADDLSRVLPYRCKAESYLK